MTKVNSGPAVTGLSFACVTDVKSSRLTKLTFFIVLLSTSIELRGHDLRSTLFHEHLLEVGLIRLIVTTRLIIVQRRIDAVPSLPILMDLGYPMARIAPRILSRQQRATMTKGFSLSEGSRFFSPYLLTARGHITLAAREGSTNTTSSSSAEMWVTGSKP